MASPSPVPRPTSFVVKNGSKIRMRVSGSIPTPSSETARKRRPSGSMTMPDQPPKARALEDSSIGEMREIRIGKKVLALDETDLWRQLCGYARAHSRPEKQSGRAANLFRNITGRWPPREFDFYTTEVAPVSNHTRNKIRSLDIAWREAQKKSRQEPEGVAA